MNRIGLSFLFGILLLTMAGCAREVDMRSGSNLGINEELAAHQAEIMKLPGVVGIYVGLAEDEKTECIRVMMKEPNPETERKIPKSLGRFRVIVEVSGEIRPLAQ